MDQRKFALLEALKLGALHAGEMRLYRRGKLPGLFDQHTRLNTEVADEAVREGLLEVARVETVGKTAVEWVRVTQRGLDFLLDAESPARALEELRDVLATNEAGLPTWIADMQQRLDEMTRRFAGELEQMRTQIEQLSRRATAAIERIEETQASTQTPIPWAADALGVLAGRQQVGLGERCSLRDLFAALREMHRDLTIRAFHHGLKTLRDKRLLDLLPDVPSGDAPGPEYALLDGPAVYYYVARAAV